METIVGVISFSAISSIINSISTLSMNIYNLSTNIKLNKNLYNDELNEILIKTDIETTIQLLESIISEIPEYMAQSTSVLLALHNVKSIISSIEYELTIINKKIEYNKNLYLLKNWRSLDFKSEVSHLESLLYILDKRRDNLFKTLEVFKNIPSEDLRKVDRNKLSCSVVLALDNKSNNVKLTELSLSPIIEEIVENDNICVI